MNQVLRLIGCLAFFLCVCMVLVIGIASHQASRDCEQRGGVMVKSVCIKKEALA